MTTEQSETDNNQITFDNFDKLRLEPFAKNLFEIIKNPTPYLTEEMGEKKSLTISLNASFGNGKTTFLKMFQNLLEEEKTFKVLFINAWELDFTNDPIINILIEFKNQIGNKEIAKNIVKAIKMWAIKNGVSYAISYGISYATNIPVSKSKIERFWNLFKNSSNSPGEIILKKSKQRKEAVRNIKEAISEYTKKEKKKLLIIVDELDRARPDYAVRFLEDMKHFFDIENVIFLVAVNRDQIEATVKCLYGQELDFEGYYRKFFILNRSLSHIDDYRNFSELIDHWFEKMTGRDNNSSYKIESTRRFSAYCKMFELTIREVENSFKIIGIDFFKRDIDYISIYFFFRCLSIKRQSIFQKILDKSFTLDDFLYFIENDPLFPNPSKEEINLPAYDRMVLNLLHLVACTFVSKNSKKQEEDEIEEIKKYFRKEMNWEYENYEPWTICKKINEYGKIPY